MRPVEGDAIPHDGLLFQKGTFLAEIDYSLPHHIINVNGAKRIERDFALTLSDGVRIFIDTYRPEGAVNVPALVSWSLYGEHLTGLSHFANFTDNKGK